MKRIISFFALLFLSILLVACKVDTNKNVPKNLSITNSILTFDEVEYALSYYVYVDEDKHKAYENRFNLNTLNLSVGLYDITVTSVIGEKESSRSSVIVYEVKEILETDKLSDADRADLLLVLDLNFVPDMTKEDFYDELNYYSYLNAVKVINNYDEAASKSGLNRIQKVELFKHIFRELNNFNDFSDVLAFYDKAIELKLNKGITANLIYDLLLTTYEMNLRMSLDHSLYDMFVVLRDETKTNIDRNINSSNYQSFVSLLDDEALKTFFSNPYIYANYPVNHFILDIIFGNRITDAETFESYLRDEDNKTLYLEIYDKAINFNNKNELNLADYELLIIQTISKANEFREYDYQVKKLEPFINDEKDVLDDEGYQILLSSKTELIKTFEDFFVFVEQLRPVVSKNLIEFFVNFDFNNIVVDEVYRYKNQIFNQLLIALPSEEAFENLFDTINIITSLFNHEGLNEFAELGSMFRSIIKVSLETINDIPKETFVTLKNEIDLMKQQGMSNDEIVQYVISSLGLSVLTEVFTEIVEQELITKDHQKVLYNILIDQLVFILKENNQSEDLINVIIKLKDLFDVFYELEMVYSENSFLLVTHISTISSIINGVLIEAINGIGRDEFVLIVEAFINSLSKVIELSIKPIHNSNGLNNVYEIVLWLAELISLETSDEVLYNIVLNEKEAVISIIAEFFVMMDSFNNNALNDFDIDFILINFTELQGYDFYYPVVSLLSSATDQIIPHAEVIVDIIFESIITVEYTNYSEEELVKMKLSVINEFAAFNGEINALGRLDFKNLSEADRLAIDTFFIKYFNFNSIN